MSRLDELIAKHCPDGVEYKSFEELIDYEQPTKYIVESTNYDSGFDIPVLTAGASFVLGYTDETEGIYSASKELPVIIFDDFTTSFHWVDFSFKVKSSAMKLLTAKNESQAMLKYLYFAMKCIPFVPSQHARHWIQTYSKFRVPIPPLPVQQEIVRSLDKFTALEAELEVELEARKKQHKYYMDELFTFSDNVPRMTLGDIGRVSMCKRIFKEQTQSVGDIPFYKIGTFGKEPDAFISQNIFDEYRGKYSFPKKGDVLLSAAGTIGRAVIYDGTPSYFQDSNIVWIANDEKKVLNKYLYYFYKVAKWAVSEGGTIARLYNDNIKRTIIPVPSLDEQDRIATILDRFETLVSDITQGLPAEIAARRKQYEYYRDKLLTFKEIGA